MRKEMQKKLNKLFPAQTQHSNKEGDKKLTQIIKTFRENHMKLIHKIEECDKRRQIQHQINKKKLSEKFLIQKHDFQSAKNNQTILTRPYSQMKSERNLERGIKQNHRKQNMGVQTSKRTCPNKSEECEEGYVSPFEDPNLKVVKVKMNKLVPLSMDRLKERLKLL